MQGSIALKGGRIDDLALVKFRETVDPKSPPIVLLSPSGSPEPFYAEFGWTGRAGTKVKLPTRKRSGRRTAPARSRVGHPVTLTYDNGDGPRIPPHHRGRRQVSVHRQGRGGEQERNPVTLYPYALISRHGTPQDARAITFCMKA